MKCLKYRIEKTWSCRVTHLQISLISQCRQASHRWPLLSHLQVQQLRLILVASNHLNLSHQLSQVSLKLQMLSSNLTLIRRVPSASDNQLKVTLLKFKGHSHKYGAILWLSSNLLHPISSRSISSQSLCLIKVKQPVKSQLEAIFRRNSQQCRVKRSITSLRVRKAWCPSLPQQTQWWIRSRSKQARSSSHLQPPQCSLRLCSHPAVLI